MTTNNVSVATAPLQERPADTIPLMIQPAGDVAVGLDDFVQQERKRPVASPVSSIKLDPERANTTTDAPRKIPGPDIKAYQHWQHWGINE
jgi:hypothetical protein